MTKMLKTLTLAMAAMTMTIAIQAQDLSSQRGESQRIDGIPGYRCDHDGLPLNPQPQHIERTFEEVDITRGFALRGKAKRYIEELNFLAVKTKGLPISIVCNERAMHKIDSEAKAGAYLLQLTDKGVTITAADDEGIFYAIQTLRQIVESPDAEDGAVRQLTIYDYPDLHYRGVVEGFYGEPWSHATRLSLIDFYGRYKMNYYIYGPKDDPYHSCPNWRLPYPQEEADNIRELVDACRRNRVHFVWAIHPGADIKWNEEDYNNLLSKFERMYDLGVRAFAIHFDDISGEGANPLRQTELLNRLNEEFVAVKGDVASLIVCPTDYTRLWANPTERGSLVRYGETLHPSIDVFWTGDAVCSDMTTSTMEWVNSRIQRPALFWWNFPVTDYARHIIMQGPVYGLSADIDDTYTRGIVTNPMEHGEASKLAMFSVADYAWNVEAYNAMDSWERAFDAIAPEVRDAYRCFAMHSCDTETGYRRVESWETDTFRMNDYTPELAAALMNEFRAIEEVHITMVSCKNKALLQELAPWLYEFGLLGKRCRAALEMLISYHSAPYNKFNGFWDAYVDNLMTNAEIESYLAHRSGTMKLQPFYENIMDEMAAAYYLHLTGELTSTLDGCGSYKSLYSTQSKAMFDNDPETYYHSGAGQRTDHWVGVDMKCVRRVSAVNVIQGRNSVDDVDYFDHAILEYSIDGEEWFALGEPMKGVYDVEWRGDAVDARYVRLRKLESEKRNWLAVRAFEINPVDASEYHLDGNPFTSLIVGAKTSIDIPAEATHCHLLLGRLGVERIPVYRLYDTQDQLVGEGRITSSELHIDTDGRVARIEISGVDRIFETIFTRELSSAKESGVMQKLYIKPANMR